MNQPKRRPGDADKILQVREEIFRIGQAGLSRQISITDPTLHRFLSGLPVAPSTRDAIDSWLAGKSAR